MKEEITHSTKQIGVNTIALIDELPNKHLGWIVAKQIVKCGTSYGADYSAASCAKLTADFTNKLKITKEEADETLYWINIMESKMIGIKSLKY
ncbi:MAG: four helix bundle protein [Bacteroidia bacterium]|nr:four helix bundle protein [Bacteroidia bacterium]